MPEEIKTEQEEIAELDDSFFNMSDEDIMKMQEAPAPDAAIETTHLEEEEEEESEPVPKVEAKDEEEKPTPPTEPKSEEEVKEPAPDEGKPNEEPVALAEGDEVKVPPEEGADKKTDTDTATKDEDKDKSTKKEPEAIDWSEVGKPFKGGKTEITAKNPAEALALMKMGADYHRKMELIKPHLKTTKMLENAGITPERLNLLIDINRGDKEALKKFLTDTKTDLVDIDTETDNNYQASNISVSDAEVELDQINTELKGSAHYEQLYTLVGTEFDKKSREAIIEKPDILRDLNQHMETGVYDVIQAELVKAKAMGQLRGLSDLDAYKQIGDAIHAEGGFNHLFEDTSNSSGSGNETTKPVDQSPSRQQIEDPKLVEKRRAASATRTAPSAGKKISDDNPLAMSDEDFLKQA